MKISEQIGGIITIALLVAPVAAQAPASPRRPRPAAVQVIVRDVSCTPLNGVSVSITGAAGSQAITDAAGVAKISLADGAYRFRFEHDGFVPLERDVTVRNGRAVEIEVALNRAPRPLAPPPAPPEPAPPPPPPPDVRPGPSVNISIPTFLDKNFVGREPLKESILACMPDATARVLQLRDSVAEHTHANLDEVLYVVAGDGAVRIAGEAVAITPGSLSAIPRGTPHAIERRGRNPLILLSTLAGAPCPSAQTRRDDAK
jgi:mannose-6-phosphate isomerase-like protein (cupin superfamily)